MADVKKDKLTLSITEVSEPKEVGQKGAKKLAFKAKTADGKELSYFTFTTKFFPIIQAKGELDGDVETSQREYDGNTYTDRKLVEVYKDGQPVGGEKKGWQPRGGKDSPEKRASIEAQKAVEIGANLWIAGKIKDDDMLVERLRMWCLSRLGVDKPLPTPVTQQAQSTPEIPLDKPVDMNVGQLLQWIMAHSKIDPTIKKGARGWLSTKVTFNDTELQDPENVKVAWGTVREVTGWTD